MPEYIEREALRDELLNISIDISNLYNCGILEGLDRATKRLNEQPAADVTPVRHGRWMRENNRVKSYIRICSECRKTAYFCGTGCSYKYCPNCGAKMDLEVPNGNE